MDTRYYKINPAAPDGDVLKEAAKVLREGGLVAFPTETVYGLGANGLNSEAVAGIYRAKGRPSDNPLILHIADAEEITGLAASVPQNAQVLAEKFWPGPLTIVVERQPTVPNAVTGGLNTVAVRLPASNVARQLIRLAGVPIAAPSANLSGRPSPTTAQAVRDDLDGKIDIIIDAGPCTIGVESTVVDCTTPVPTLLRPGGVTYEMLLDVLGEVEIDPALEGAETIPKSPGMKYTHYAPAAPLVLVEAGDDTAGVTGRAVKAAVAEGKRVGAVVSVETAAGLPAEALCAVYGQRGDTAKAAVNLYTMLRYFDDKEVDIIVAEGLKEHGLGLAVMNRLRKAAGYHIIRR